MSHEWAKFVEETTSPEVVSLSQQSSQNQSSREFLGFGDSARAVRFAARLGRSKRDDGNAKKKKLVIFRGETAVSRFQHQASEEALFKVVVDGDDGGVDMRQCFGRVDTAIQLRTKYMKRQSSRIVPLPKKIAIGGQQEGIYTITGHDPTNFTPMVSYQEFAADIEQLLLTSENTTCRKACEHRLNIIQERSKMHFLLNLDIEERLSYRRCGGVYAPVTKVDNSVAMTLAMPAQDTLEWLLEIFNHNPDFIVGRHPNSGNHYTLKELFDEFGAFDPRLLTIEGLGWQMSSRRRAAHGAASGTPLGSRLLQLLQEPSSQLMPLYIKRVIASRENAKHVCAGEYRLRLHGSHPGELGDVARMLKQNEIGPFHRAVWVLELQLDDRFPSHLPEGQVRTLQDQIDNIFLPLIHATLEPDNTYYNAVAWLLPQIGAFQIETPSIASGSDFVRDAKPPVHYRFREDHPHSLYLDYFIWSNLSVLNSLRMRRGMNTFQIRVAGGNNTIHQYLSGFLFADVVTSCAGLTNHPVLQYLYGFHGVGLTFSPLYYNSFGIPYEKNPLPKFLHRCLNVSLSTETPLFHHHNSEPLIEEHATAQKLCRLSALDMTELARNSVIMSCFPKHVKEEWLGENYSLGVRGNQVGISHVHNRRLELREESWDIEQDLMKELHRRKSIGPGGSQPNFVRLSNVKDVEYFTVRDSRIRFPRTVICGPHKDDVSTREATPLIAQALEMRRRYIWAKPAPWLQSQRDVEQDFRRTTATFEEDDWTFSAKDSIFVPFPKSTISAKWPKHIATLEEFIEDLQTLKRITSSKEVKDFAYRRLQLLDHKFKLHLALNHANEAGITEQKESSNRDIYQAIKVDTHVHMAAGMTARQLLSFFKDKLRNSSEDIAMQNKEGVVFTLGKLMKDGNITENLTVDMLNVQADHTLFERFDNFNGKYQPMNNAMLRTLMLKTENFMEGRYFAELIHAVFGQYSKDSCTFAENRISIYGANPNEWAKLAEWFDTHGMASKHNKFLVQIPRVYPVWRGTNQIASFAQYLKNIFEPLWLASLHPSENPWIHNLLKHISGFDSVDNESYIDAPIENKEPWNWTQQENPPYNYYMYHMWANIRTLNEFRAMRGFSTFDFRPHCGEAGSDDHLLGCFLTADAIGHGINLQNDQSLQYLYYMAQIGLHLAPLSNNALFMYYLHNPFPDFLRRGLNVSLSTDDPMMFHQTSEPLIEEYSIAARVWGLSQNDMCEIARNSVKQSGFDHDFKRTSIGEKYYMSSSLGNDALKSHLSDIRVAYRFETYHTEVEYLETVLQGSKSIPRHLHTLQEEQEIIEEQLGIGAQEVLLSTYDQALEVTRRDITEKENERSSLELKLSELRRQHKSLLERIAAIGNRRKELERAEQEKKNNKKPERIVYSQFVKKEDGSLRALQETEKRARVLEWHPAVRAKETSGMVLLPRKVKRDVPRIPTPPVKPK